MADPDVAFATLDYDHGERFQTLRRELGVGSFGINLILLEPREWASWEEGGPGRPPLEIPLPENPPG
jgi:hypothetical protein